MDKVQTTLYIERENLKKAKELKINMSKLLNEALSGIQNEDTREILELSAELSKLRLQENRIRQQLKPTLEEHDKIMEQITSLQLLIELKQEEIKLVNTQLREHGILHEITRNQG